MIDQFPGLVYDVGLMIATMLLWWRRLAGGEGTWRYAAASQVDTIGWTTEAYVARPAAVHGRNFMRSGGAGFTGLGQRATSIKYKVCPLWNSELS